MIHDVSTALAEALASLSPAEKAIGRADLEALEIPEPIRDYLLSVLEYQAERITADISRVRDPWVAESADVSRARTALGIAMSRSVHIPASEVDGVITEAAETVVAYLVRPARTLNRHLFRDGEDEVDVDELHERLRRFSSYPYFSEVLQHYFVEKEISRIDRSRLDGLLQRIDRQMTSDFEPDEWADVLQPLFDTLGILPSFEHGIPAQLIQTFFRDKQAGRQLARLESFDAATIVSRQEVVELLRASKQRAEETPAPAATVPTPQPAVVEPPPPPAPPKSDEPLPLWMQFQKQPADVQAEASSASAPKPIWQQFQTEPAPPVRRDAPLRQDLPLRQDPIEDDRPGLDAVERLILGERGAKHRKMFVRRLFQGSEADYHTSLEALAEAGSWHEASRVIAESIFRRFDVNIYDDAAVTFTNAVEQRFAQRRRL